MPKWKKIKVVVEVPVCERGSKFSERDLVWAVKRAMEADGFWQDRKYLRSDIAPLFGKLEVKEFNKVMAYAKTTQTN